MSFGGVLDNVSKVFLNNAPKGLLDETYIVKMTIDVYLVAIRHIQRC